MTRSCLPFLATLLLAGFSTRTSAFSVTFGSTRMQRLGTGTGTGTLYMKRGRGSFRKEVESESGNRAPGSTSSGFSGQKTSSSPRTTTTTTRSINWCPMPSGQALPSKPNEIGLLDTQLPTLKNSATNPTGAVAVVKAADNEQTYCFASSCPSCQIPLTKAKLAPPTDSTEPHPRLVCGFCQATYSLKDGARLQGADAVTGAGGLLGGLVKNVVAANNDTKGPLKLYKLGQKGKDLVIAVD